jgi:hypothetical protein
MTVQDPDALKRGRGILDAFGGVWDWLSTTGAENLRKSFGIGIKEPELDPRMTEEQRINRLINKGVNTATLAGGALTGGAAGVIIGGSALVGMTNLDEPAIYPPEAVRRKDVAREEAKKELIAEGKLEESSPPLQYVLFPGTQQSSGDQLMSSMAEMIPLMLMMMMLPQMMQTSKSRSKDVAEIDKDDWS